MTNNGSLLPDSIAHIKHLATLDLMMRKRFSELELEKILVYMIDTVNADAIPYLAEQFDVLGYKGFRLATSDGEKREIIKKSIELHRYKGTPWAVKEALISIGFGEAILEEHVDGHWANFRVSIDLGERPLGIVEINDLTRMISEYKNARSHLVDLSYKITLADDNITVLDDQTDAQAISETDTLTAGGDFRHNGLFLRNGSRNYSKDADVLSISIL